MEIKQFILIGIIILIIVGVMSFTIVFLFSKAFDLFYSALELSPLEGDVFIENTAVCSDSDGGIYFGDKGEVILKKSFLFFDWDVILSDYCSNYFLTEYYCTGEGYAKGVVECGVGCFDGKCI